MIGAGTVKIVSTRSVIDRLISQPLPEKVVERGRDLLIEPQDAAVPDVWV